jgi:hypothetical protein
MGVFPPPTPHNNTTPHSVSESIVPRRSTVDPAPLRCGCRGSAEDRPRSDSRPSAPNLDRLFWTLVPRYRTLSKPVPETAKFLDRFFLDRDFHFFEFRFFFSSRFGVASTPTSHQHQHHTTERRGLSRSHLRSPPSFFGAYTRFPTTLAELDGFVPTLTARFTTLFDQVSDDRRLRRVSDRIGFEFRVSIVSSFRFGWRSTFVCGVDLQAATCNALRAIASHTTHRAGIFSESN